MQYPCLQKEEEKEMKIAVLNGAKVNFDGIIDYSVLAEEGDELFVCDM